LRGRCARARARRVARPRDRRGRRPDARRDRCDRRTPTPGARGAAAAGALRRGAAARFMGAGRARGEAGRAGRGRGGGVPELRAGLRAQPRLGAARAARQHGRLEPLVRDDRGRGRGAPPPRRPPVAHVTLRDLDWLDAQLAALARAGVRMAMIAPALVDGRPLSHPGLERAWAAFVHHGVSPVFHVADQPKVFDEAWYTDRNELGVFAVDAVFLYVPAALACTDLILNGVLERHPELRLGIVELSAVWVPLSLLMLDGGPAFVQRLGGQSTRLRLRPSDYFRRQVRVSSFAYELPRRIARMIGEGDVLMACSDYPHSEGTASPVADYAAPGKHGLLPAEAPGFFAGNAAFLLHRD